MAGSTAHCTRCLPRTRSAFRAIALGPALPRILNGPEPAVAVSNINDFGVGGRNSNAAPIANTFEAMYAQSVDTVLHGTGQETFDAVKMLKSADPAKYKPAPGADYPRGRFGDSLRQLAQLIKANLGVAGGFRRHRRMGSPRQRRQHARADCQRPARLLAGTLCVLDRPRRSWRRHRCGHHVRVRPHRARKRQSRHWTTATPT